MRAFYVLLFIVWISSTFCHIWSGKRSLSLSGVWIRGGASENLNSNSGNMIVLRLRSYDGAVSRLNVDASQSIQDLASEITKIISPNILSNAEVTIKGDPAQSLDKLKSNTTLLSSLALKTGDWIAVSVPKDKRKVTSTTAKKSQTDSPASLKQSPTSKSASPAASTETPKKSKKVFTVKDLEAERLKLLQMHKESVQGEVKIYMLQDGETSSKADAPAGRRRRGRRVSPVQGVERALQRIAQQGCHGLLLGRMTQVKPNGNRDKAATTSKKSMKGSNKKDLVVSDEDGASKSRFTYEVLAVCEVSRLPSSSASPSSRMCLELKDIGAKTGLQVLGVVIGLGAGGKPSSMWTWDNLRAGLTASTLMSAETRNHTLSLSIRLQTKEDLKDDDGQAKSKKSKAKSVKFSSKEGGFVMEAFQLHPLAYDLHATGALGQLDDKIHEKASLGEAHPGKSSSSSNANKKKKKKKNGHEYAEGEVGEDVISLSQPILYGGREVTSLPLSTLSRPLGVSNVAIPSSSPSFIDHTFPSLMEMESSPEILVSSQVYLRKVIKNLSEGKMLHGAEGGRVRSLWLLRALQAYLQPASFAALCEAVRSALDAEEVRLSEEVKLELQMVSEGMEEPAGDGEEL